MRVSRKTIVVFILLVVFTIVIGSVAAIEIGGVEKTKLIASDGKTGAHYGTSVAIHENSIVVGAELADVGSNGQQGAAYVYERSGTNWSQTAQLTADDGAAVDRLGVSAAIEGDVIVVGSYLADVAGHVDQGAAYVFQRGQSGWQQMAKLTADDGQPYDGFGYRVSISGQTIVVGAWRADIGGSVDQGAAYVFESTESDPSNNWTQTAKLTADDGTSEDRFGGDVAVDGGLIVVGAAEADVGNIKWQGTAYVFKQNDAGDWVRLDKLIANDGAGSSKFGETVEIEGEQIIIGAWQATVNGNQAQGAVYVFEPTDNDSSHWEQTAKLVADDGAAVDRFGVNFGIDAHTIVVGAQSADIAGMIDAGTTYIFRNTNGQDWEQVAKFTASDVSDGDWFGNPDISGHTVVASAALAEVDGNNNQGAAYVFELSGTVMVDIMPRREQNILPRWRRGLIPVAVLSSETFAAPEMVETGSLTFGRTGDEASLWWSGRPNRPLCFPFDVNHDGLLDLFCGFKARKADFQCGDIEGVLKGVLVDGLPFEGRDSVRVVPCHR